MSEEKINTERRKFLTAATSVIGGIGAAFAAAPFIASWMPSERAKALGAPIEVNISMLEPGAQLTVEWRGQPIWVIRRTAAMLSGLPALNNELRDPFSAEDQQPPYAQNLYRSIKEEYLVLVGLCTHLGCVPTYRPDIGGVQVGWPGGFFCPCHGSKFDLAGRVFKGVPAPLNLVVPPYHYATDAVIVIGEGQKAA
jgi:ubiquinol-cytochrome c reductase iron-sulfur subunit